LPFWISRCRIWLYDITLYFLIVWWHKYRTTFWNMQIYFGVLINNFLLITLVK
jgi:hypothetical protein